MTTNAMMYALCAAGVLAFAIWMLTILFRFYNSADAERYRRMAIQGPFVPVDRDDDAADDQRKIGRA